MKKGSSALVLAVCMSMGTLFSGCIEEVSGVFVPMDLRCEYMSNPLGVDTTSPRFSWNIRHPERGQAQSAYQILVASSRKNLDAGIGDRWNSGKVMSDQSVNVVYGGKPLESGETCYWKVRVWDKDGHASQYSDVATFDMGLLRESDWKAEWIGAEDISAPLLRKEFTLDKEVKKARAYISGLGCYELYINGGRVGNDVLNPGQSEYSRRVLYSTYDVTNLLKKGKNAVGVMLGRGWWGKLGSVYGDVSPRMILQLDVEFTDGANTSVVSDTTWKTSSGPIVADDLYDGEIYDARQERPGWDRPGYDDYGWDNAQSKPSPGGVMDSQLMPAIRVIEVMDPVALTEPLPGKYVFDFGQNFAGWSKLMVSGPAGTKITLKTAEILNDDGTINQSSYGGAKSTDSYILKGEGQEVYEPRFTYHGFRYVEVTGFPGRPTLENLKGCVVHSAVEPSGSFSSSSSLLNQIHHNVIWSEKSNYHSVPTDCPHREKRGYTGDGQVSAEATIHNFNMAALYTKWLNDMRDSQLESGKIPNVAPWYNGYDGMGGGVPWGSAYILLPWWMYEYYRDVRILEDHYPNMKMHLEYLRDLAKNDSNPEEEYIINEFGPYWESLGEWCSPGRTDCPNHPVVSTYYWYKDALTMSKIAEVLGKSSDADYYLSLANSIRDAFNSKFLNRSDNTYGGSPYFQTYQILPLEAGMVPEANEDMVFDNLVRDIMIDNNGHLDTGIFGTKYLFPVLMEHGRGDVAFTIVSQTTYPSYGYQIGMGATTLWERWEYLTEGMASFNHHMFDTVDEFFYKYLAGITPMSPGYRKISIRPCILGDLEWVNASIETVRGTVSSRWVKGTDSLVLEVTIPVNSEAEICVPVGSDSAVITEGGRKIFENNAYLGGVEGIASGERRSDCVELDVGSGTYLFEVRY